jgi:hypothetical protein
LAQAHIAISIIPAARQVLAVRVDRVCNFPEFDRDRNGLDRISNLRILSRRFRILGKRGGLMQLFLGLVFLSVLIVLAWFIPLGIDD